MKVIQDSQSYSVIRFEKGERLLETFRVWLASRDIKGAFFYGLGGALSLRVGSYDITTKEYTFKEFSGEHFEVLNLVGNVALLEENIKIHSHISFSDSQFCSYGGHLEELEVGATLELYLHILEPLVRQGNEEVGLALLT